MQERSQFPYKEEINEWVRSLRDEEIDSVPSAAENTGAEALDLS
jgi:hypothetical protein